MKYYYLKNIWLFVIVFLLLIAIGEGCSSNQVSNYPTPTVKPPIAPTVTPIVTPTITPTATPLPIPPAPPTNLDILTAGYGRVCLEWYDNSNNEDSFILQRKVGVDGTYIDIPISRHQGLGTVSYTD